MGLETRSKKELIDLIHQLQDKVKELKPIESAQTAQLEELKHNAAGIVKRADGKYGIVKIKYDLEKNAAAIAEVEDLNTREETLMWHNFQKYAGEEIMRKARGGKYDK